MNKDKTLNTDGSEDTLVDTERRLRQRIALLTTENTRLEETIAHYLNKTRLLNAAIDNAIRHLEHVRR